MICHYTIIRYVPNPIAEEFINIAIVVFSETEAQCSITQNWQRVASFGDPEDLPMLQEFCDRICTAFDRQRTAYRKPRRWRSFGKDS